MSYFLTPPPTWFEPALEKRVAAQENPGAHRAWGQRMPFIRLSTNVRKTDGGDYPYGTHIMGGEMKTLNLSYDSSNRNVPLPGVKSANVQFKGSLGSIKEVKVEFSCWNMEQLSEMEKLYMSLGKSLVLEWGWSSTTEESSTVPASLLTPDQLKSEFGEFAKAVSTKRQTSEGCYDAVKGLVTKFNWDLNDKGGFDCMTTFVSPAEAVLQADTKEGKGTGPCDDENDDEDAPKDDTDIAMYLKSITDGKEGFFSFTNPSRKTESFNARSCGTTIRMDKELSDDEKKNRSGWQKFTGWFGHSEQMSTQPYITWDAMEEMLNTLLQPTADNAKTGDGAEGVPTYFKSNQNLVKRTMNCTARLDSRNSLIRNHRLLASMDPTKCILPGQAAWEHPNYTDDGRESSDSRGTEDFDSTSWIKKFKKFQCKDSSYTREDGTRVDIKDKEKKGYLSNILLNVFWLRMVEREVSTLEEFINKVLEGVNSACGDVWDFMVHVNPENEALLTVSDSECSAGSDKGAVVIPIFGRNAIAKSVTINTEVSSELKAMIMYGSNTSGGDEKSDIPAEYSLFGAAGSLKDLTPSLQNLEKDKEPQCPEGGDAEGETPEEVFANSVESMLDGVSSETISQATVAMKNLTDWPNSSDEWSPPTLPLKFNFKVDGMSGLMWGNCVYPNYIPDRYKEKVYFMVTKVQQSIDKTKWETEVETIMRMIGD